MNISESLLWTENNINLQTTNVVSKKIAEELSRSDFFCLWLIGDIGAGKTFLTGAILKELGLHPETAVTSPTFSYLSDYIINKKTYGHLDFYRLADSSSRNSLSDLLSYCDYDGLFLEWPENLQSHAEIIRPTKILRIEKSADLLARNYNFYDVNS